MTTERRPRAARRRTTATSPSWISILPAIGGDPIQRLERAAEQLERGRVVELESARWLARAFRQLCKACKSQYERPDLSVLLGLPAAGHLERAARDREIRCIARDLPGATRWDRAQGFVNLVIRGDADNATVHLRDRAEKLRGDFPYLPRTTRHIFEILKCSDEDDV